MTEDNAGRVVAKTPSSNRFVYMDSLRGLAAVGVVLSHLFTNFFMSFFRPEDGDTISRFFASTPLPVFYNGPFSIYIFFVLSGFVLSASVSHSRLGLTATLVRRYLRLTVPIAAITLLFLIVYRAGLFFNDRVADSAPHIAAMFPPNYMPTVGDWLKKSLYGVYLTGSYRLDGVLWTMKVEIWGSLLVYLVWFFLPNKPLRMAACLIGFLVLAITVAKHTSFQGIYLFPAGILIYDLSHGERMKLLGENWPMKVGAPIFIIGLLCGAWLIKRPVLPGINLFIEGVLEPIVGNISRYQAQAAGAILIVTAVALTKGLQPALSNRFFSYLGAISFPLYLVHFLALAGPGCALFAWSYEHYGIEAARWITLPITFLIAIALGTLLTPLVERPSIALSKRVGDRVDRFMRSSVRFRLPWARQQPAR